MRGYSLRIKKIIIKSSAICLMCLLVSSFTNVPFFLIAVYSFASVGFPYAARQIRNNYIFFAVLVLGICVGLSVLSAFHKGDNEKLVFILIAVCSMQYRFERMR